MDGEASFSQIAPPTFDGDNYDPWIVKKESYLEALDLWEVVEEDYEIPRVEQSYHGSNKIVQRKKNQEGKGEIMSLYWCLTNNLQ